MYYSSTKKCLSVSTFLGASIFGGCNPVVTTLSAYGWILHESGPYAESVTRLNFPSPFGLSSTMDELLNL